MSKRGGARPGAGRPKGLGKYGEATTAMRLPLSRVEEIRTLLLQDNPYQLPLYGCKVQAGFPSPADDYIERKLDLNSHLIQHPAATFLVRATGDSMMHAGIQPGDILVVDKSLEATHGKIIIAAVHGELTVKRLSRRDGRVQLLAANPDYPALDITHEQDVIIWGVVTFVIHEMK
ncbi:MULTISPECIES: LexA family protein [Legionella]|uniref:Translesion error-prone DNA polymerase V autoproteolytic subunit n=1 Tax=Legionella septentrionalis TaxID=2498109 RepID=A0A3S0X139_9GAMM|nr:MULTISPECIES: translesion error-prone DNA polymerase V autoproteolytic subunit [Legionella]MCP0914218.1 translesion error-prone DNA polymerase V autoproteolytic subunit [Legionella sp. 27cVA30]RUQ89271.1 translesion error-prone DNA polymerase V autoproteolytic subunit [Legionella septentrionalis]RUR00640.1 translesion error-prone DNA polymerase V autoproteolytic subunit [Legionella septentrionalis]RUR11881.1 translesion error-prone DNA polymerase V autoproteolytic subunit [Legionella septent